MSEALKSSLKSVFSPEFVEYNLWHTGFTVKILAVGTGNNQSNVCLVFTTLTNSILYFMNNCLTFEKQPTEKASFPK